MKKLSKKLVLSSLSLGLAVATLSTTTFAWYTNNTRVSVDPVQGSTEAAATNGLLISNASNGVYRNSTSIDTPTVDGAKMTPLQAIQPASKTYGLYLVDGTTAATTTASSGQFLQFSVFIKATSGTEANKNVYLENLEIKNTANSLNALTSADILADYTAGEDGSGWAANANQYSVDATAALNFAYKVTEHTSETAAASAVAAPTLDKIFTSTTPIYSVNNIAGALGTTGLSTTAANVDALKYYEAVTGAAPAGTRQTVTEIETTTAGHAVISNISTEKVYEVTFVIWLDGWDKYCFDACKGQTFNISFGFTFDETAKVAKQATPSE